MHSSESELPLAMSVHCDEAYSTNKRFIIDRQILFILLFCLFCYYISVISTKSTLFLAARSKKDDHWLPCLLCPAASVWWHFLGMYEFQSNPLASMNQCQKFMHRAMARWNLYKQLVPTLPRHSSCPRTKPNFFTHQSGEAMIETICDTSIVCVLVSVWLCALLSWDILPTREGERGQAQKLNKKAKPGGAQLTRHQQTTAPITVGDGA